MAETATALSPYAVFEPPLASNQWVADATGKVLDMNATKFLSTFYDNYVGSKDGYTVTKTSLGKDQSGLYDIYEYVFTPPTYTETILLSSGMHTYELPASFGLAHFIKHLMTTPYMHEGFKKLKENVRIKVIPIINPWGFNQSPKIYGNVNGVNINRNFDSNGRWATFPSLPGDEWNYKGTAPFSEAETVILRDWAIANSTADWWIDCHTGMNNPHVDNWIYYLSADPLVPKILTALDKLEDRIKVKYDKTNPTKTVEIDNPGTIRQWYAFEQLGIGGMTVEIANTFWGTTLNNEAEDITEYEVALAAYVFELLDVSSPHLKEFIRSTDNNVRILKSELSSDLNQKDLSIFKQLDGVVIDRFDRDNGAIGFAETGQQWSTNEGVFSIMLGKVKSGGNANDRNAIDTGISDYVISADIAWNSYAGIHFRYTDAGNHYLVRINSTGVNLQKVVGSTITVLKDYPFTPTQGKTYRLTIIAKGPFFTVYLDNDKVLEFMDSTFLTQTKVGLRATNDSISTFDNIVVRKILDFESSSKKITATLSNGWTGTIEYSKSNSGLVSLRGTVQVGTIGDSLDIITMLSGFFPLSGGHSFVCHDSTGTISYLGFYIASSNGKLYFRKPGNTTVTPGTTLTFNTVFQAS